MAARGREFTPEMTECITRLKCYFDEERKAGPIASTENASARTAAALGVGEATVKRVMARYNSKGSAVFAEPSKPRGRPPFVLSDSILPIVREEVRSQNLRGQRVSAEKLRTLLCDEYKLEVASATFWRALKRWGFAHGTGKRRCALKEQPYVLQARREYLRRKRGNRNPDGTVKRPEIYLDETYVNKNHSNQLTWYREEDGPWVNKPSGVGPRLIVVNAIGRNGWIKKADLVFQAKKRTGDYHGQMNWDNFSRWFATQLLPNIPDDSMIILDNARYHNVYVEDSTLPSGSSSKDELRDWLTRNGIPWQDDMLKVELWRLCKRFAPKPEYMLDRLAREKGHVILRTPPYHPELQPIEICWAIVKNELADKCDFTMANLKNQIPKAFSKVTAETCRKIIARVAEVEDRFWLEDEQLDELYANDEYLGESVFDDLFGCPP
jgi:transposase